MSVSELTASVVPRAPLAIARVEGVPGQDLIAAHAPLGAQADALRRVRGQLALRWFNGVGQNLLAVVSAERHEGRSFVAANLAVVMSQWGKRTLLIDADLRNPAQQRIFGLGHGAGLAEILDGQAGPDAIKSIASLPDLALLTAGKATSNAADLLGRPQCVHFLRDLAAHFDAVIVDTPAVADSGDAQTVAAIAGAAVIVARQNMSRIARLRGVMDALGHAKATVVGAVLNDA